MYAYRLIGLVAEADYPAAGIRWEWMYQLLVALFFVVMACAMVILWLAGSRHTGGGGTSLAVVGLVVSGYEVTRRACEQCITTQSLRVLDCVQRCPDWLVPMVAIVVHLAAGWLLVMSARSVRRGPVRAARR